MDIQKLYNQHNAIREYVDKYAYKHQISLEEAFKHKMVAEYIKFLYERNIIK